MLLIRSLHCATILPSNSYYTVVASIFLVSASCKAICRVASVRTSDYSQPFWLKRHALLMPHMLIKYAHMLICICAGKGSQHFSAISLTLARGRRVTVICLSVCLSVCHTRFCCLIWNNLKTKDGTDSQLCLCIETMVLHRTVTARLISMD